MGDLLLRGKKIGSVKGILFDKDGTLINSEKRLFLLSKRRVKEAVIQFKREEYSKKDIKNLQILLSKAYGIKQDEINPNGSLAIASKKDNLITTATILCIFGKTWHNALDDANNIFEKVSTKINSVDKHLEDKNLLPGTTNFLEKCQKENIKLALISNDNNSGIRRFLNANEIQDFFPIFWSADNEPPKPHANSVKKLCEAIKLHPNECALISDSDTDMRMAFKSNISIVLGFTGGWQKPPLIYEHHHLIKHWDELTI